MSESRQRNHMVAVRLNPAELAQLQQMAAGKGISTFLRETVLAAAVESRTPSGLNPHAQYRRGDSWRLDFAPGRIIGVRPASGFDGAYGVGMWSGRDARALAAALLEAADVADLPEMEEVAAS